MANNTKTRRAVLEILLTEKMPLSIKEIYEKLDKNGYGVWLSTIYRAIDTLVNENEICKISVRDKNLYMMNKQQHSHFLICVSCNKIESLDICPIDESNLPINTDFEIIGHKLEFFGYCEECKLT